MIKPEGYDNSAAHYGPSVSPLIGPKILIVKKLALSNKETGQELLISFDIAEGICAQYYTKLSVKYSREQYLEHRQRTTGVSLPYFRGMIKAFEESNNGFTFDFDESKLLNQKVGANLRYEQYYKENNEIGRALRVAYFCSIDSIKNEVHKIMPDRPPRRRNDPDPGPSEEHIPF